MVTWRVRMYGEWKKRTWLGLGSGLRVRVKVRVRVRVRVRA